MNMKYLFSIIVFLSFYFTIAQDCNFTYTGEVSNIHDKSPIIDATVYLKELDKYTTTDFDGKFRFEDLCAGTYTFEISHLSSKTKTITEIIDGNSFGKITIEEHTQKLKEVVLRGSNNGNSSNSLKKSVVKTKTLEKYSSGSMGDALKEVSGVSTLNTGNAIVKPMINGLHSSRVVIMNNNVRMQDQDWGAEHAPNVDLNSAGSISVIKGAGALAYSGDAIGGVVVIEPRKPITSDSIYGKIMLSGQTQKDSTKFNFQGYNGNAELTKTFENGWFISGQGSHKNFGDFAAANYILTNTGTKSTAYSFNTGKSSQNTGFELYYSFVDNEIAILSAAHIGTIRDLVDAINNSTPSVINPFSKTINHPKQDVKHHLAKASFNHRFNAFGKVSLQYDFQNNRRLEYDKRIGDLKDTPAVDLLLKTHTASIDFKLEPYSKNTFNFGLMGRYQNNYPNPGTKVKRLIPDYIKHDFGTYVTAKFNISDNTTIDAGWRYDYNKINALKYYQTTRWESLGYDKTYNYLVINDTIAPGQVLTNPIFQYHNVSTAIGIKQKIGGKITAMLNYSLANRAPNPSELFSDGLHHSAARIELGALDITQETSHRFSTALEYKNNHVSISLEPFFNNVFNFIYIRPTGTQKTKNRGAYATWEYIQSDSYMLGLDTSVSIAFTKNWQLSNNSSLLKGTDIVNNIPLLDIPPFNTITTLTYQTQKWPQFECNLNSEFFATQKRYPNNNFYFNDKVKDENIYVDISTPPNGYHLLNLDGNLKFKAGKTSELTVGLQINNLLNKSYRNYLNRLRLFADDLGRSITLNTKLNF